VEIYCARSTTAPAIGIGREPRPTTPGLVR